MRRGVARIQSVRSMSSKLEVSTSCTASNGENTDRILGFTLLHEFSHLDYRLQPRLLDYAYGSARCADLAEEDGEAAYNNADSWMLIALGTYWADKCGRDIPLSEE